MYMGWICFPFDEDEAPVFLTEEPPLYKYVRIIPIQFSVLHRWTEKDNDLYRNIT